MSRKVIPWWQKKANLALAVFLLAAGYFLITEHRAHVIQWLPWVLILGCVFMHLFMHGGHGHGGGRDSDDDGPGGNTR
jgi:hypothetical protein